MRSDAYQEERPQRVAIVGDGPEFLPLLEFLAGERRFDVARFEQLTELASMQVLKFPPDLVVVLQSRLCQYAQDEVDALRRVLGEAHWLAVAGSYAEGEGRTGQPLTGVDVVHWTAAIERLLWLRSAALGETGVQIDDLGSPARPADRFVILNQGKHPYPDSIGVVATQPQAALLIETCEAVGFCAERLPSEAFRETSRRQNFEHLNLCLWSCESAQGRQPAPLQVVVKKIAPCPVLAIVDFVRADEYAALRAIGVSGVLHRPFVLEDLVGQISRLARPTTLPARSKEHRQAS